MGSQRNIDWKKPDFTDVDLEPIPPEDSLGKIDFLLTEARAVLDALDNSDMTQRKEMTGVYRVLSSVRRSINEAIKIAEYAVRDAPQLDEYDEEADRKRSEFFMSLLYFHSLIDLLCTQENHQDSGTFNFDALLGAAWCLSGWVYRKFDDLPYLEDEAGARQ